MRRGYGWKAAQWVCGVLGSVAAFFGLFLFFGPEGDTVGLGGDWVWRVGETDTNWAYGLLAGGILLLAALVWLIMAGRKRTRHAETPMGDLLWHVGVFVLVNVFLWAQDFALGAGLNYAYVATGIWGIGLAFHAFMVFTARDAAELEKPEKELLPH